MSVPTRWTLKSALAADWLQTQAGAERGSHAVLYESEACDDCTDSDRRKHGKLESHEAY